MCLSSAQVFLRCVKIGKHGVGDREVGADTNGLFERSFRFRTLLFPKREHTQGKVKPRSCGELRTHAFKALACGFYSGVVMSGISQQHERIIVTWLFAKNVISFVA